MGKIKTILGILCFIILYGCGCSDDETINYNLNEFESSAMSTTAQENLQFINSEQEIEIAKISDKTTERRDLNFSNDKSCMVVLAESQENQLLFENIGRTFTTIIEKRDENKSHIVVADDTGFYGIDNLNTENLEESLTDFSTDGFEFNSIFVLKSGSHSGFIVYSPSVGIEFIKNADGSYLKRLE